MVVEDNHFQNERKLRCKTDKNGKVPITIVILSYTLILIGIITYCLVVVRHDCDFK